MDSMDKQSCELLAPAGNVEAFKAAIENGADAIYLGGNLFNARQFAGNFNNEELVKAIDYAHLRGVKVYLTLNILIKDRELRQAVEYANFVRENGIDGVIIQDLGLFSLLQELFPELPLHASTQMTINDLSGAKVAEKLGFSRVVLARELSLEEINLISNNINIDVETFVHGALCVCYSGQCLMSSLIGGRSGNRGTCAQPCRMPYKLVTDENNVLDNGYLISTRDIKSVYFIGDIIEAGVKSLKIEGRMKTPEYVGLVTEKYRKAIDHYLNPNSPSLELKDEEELLQIFNRGGFSKGYYFGKNNEEIVYKDNPKNIGIPIGTVLSYDKGRLTLKVKLTGKIENGDGIEVLNDDSVLPGGVVTGIEMKGKFKNIAYAGEIVNLSRIKINNTGKGAKLIKPGDRVIRTSDKSLIDRIKSTYINGASNRKRPIAINCRIIHGKPMELNVFDITTGLEVSVTGDIPEEAKSSDLTYNRVERQISKIGGNPFYIEEINIELDEGLFVPISKINELRRDALEQFSNSIIESFKRPAKEADLSRFNKKLIHSLNDIDNQNEVIISVFNYAKLLELYKHNIISKIDRLYIPFDSQVEENSRLIEDIKYKFPNTKLLFNIPNITRGNTKAHVDDFIKLTHKFLDGIVIGNLGQLEYISWDELRGKMIVADVGLNIYNAATILKLRELGVSNYTISPELDIDEIPISNNTECIIYGRIPAMITEYCPIDMFDNKDSTKRNFYLQDRKNVKYPLLINEFDKRTVILSSYPFKFKKDKVQKLLARDVKGFRINIFDEDVKEVEAIISELNRYLKR